MAEQRVQRVAARRALAQIALQSARKSRKVKATGGCAFEQCIELLFNLDDITISYWPDDTYTESIVLKNDPNGGSIVRRSKFRGDARDPAAAHGQLIVPREEVGRTKEEKVENEDYGVTAVKTLMGIMSGEDVHFKLLFIRRSTWDTREVEKKFWRIVRNEFARSLQRPLSVEYLAIGAQVTEEEVMGLLRHLQPATLKKIRLTEINWVDWRPWTRIIETDQWIRAETAEVAKLAYFPNFMVKGDFEKYAKDAHKRQEKKRQDAAAALTTANRQ